MLVAKNPVVATQSFHVIMASFVQSVLRYGRNGPGLFRTCTGYYGMVEAQGQGMLHCHFVVWLKEHLIPQSMVEQMLVDCNYERTVIEWLEGILKCELPDDEMVVPKTVTQPVLSKPDPHSCQPLNTSVMSNTKFFCLFSNDVQILAEPCNWHIHNHTCWKYLRPLEKQSDENCWMQMDGITHPNSTIDKTGSITLQCRHPWSSNYNNVCLYFSLCNMDIEFIGLGQGAEALMYYITDYVMKVALPLYKGLATLSHAITMLGTTNLNPEMSDMSCHYLVHVVNLMMGKHKMSQQQVMAHLLGNGDKYCSDSFCPLFLGTFKQYVLDHLQEGMGPIDSLNMLYLCQCQDDMSNTSLNVDHTYDEMVYLSFAGESITVSNQLQDYIYCPAQPFLEHVSLWFFISNMDKVPLSAEHTQLAHVEG
ncbi:hypothetical protein CALCODRAFT_426147 [Calocera cornea HHB12733]|uniref:Helitron helicase-like domain-containing protein n=1 Tax=Calocera cornea HHB12733 TaxID=1353952 RepID=A0A165JZ64_9BASI|nr:hypothetical protein CALCODRAFT_426147 [Calocera cornea HHB12733]